jgi:hypothetical protein
MLDVGGDIDNVKRSIANDGNDSIDDSINVDGTMKLCSGREDL